MSKVNSDNCERNDQGSKWKKIKCWYGTVQCPLHLLFFSPPNPLEIEMNSSRFMETETEKEFKTKIRTKLRWVDDKI